MIVFHFIFARKHSELKAVPLAAAFDEAGFSELQRAYNEQVVDAAKDFGAEYAEVLFGSIDGEILKVHHLHSFQNPSELEAGRKAKALSKALRIRDENNRAEQNLQAAEERLAIAGDYMQELTDDQRKLLADFDAKQQLVQEAAEADAADTEAARQLEIERRAAAVQSRTEAGITSATSSTTALRDSTVVVKGPVLPGKVRPQTVAPVPQPATTVLGPVDEPGKPRPEAVESVPENPVLPPPENPAPAVAPSPNEPSPTPDPVVTPPPSESEKSV